MALLTAYPERKVLLEAQAPAEATTPHASHASPASPVPVGGPKESHAKEVLLTLRTRLQAQLDGEESDGSPEARALRESVAHRYNQVETALTRIEEGKYGICTDCLRPIQADRLVIQPFSTRCVSCQDRADRRPGTQF